MIVSFLLAIPQALVIYFYLIKKKPYSKLAGTNPPQEVLDYHFKPVEKEKPEIEEKAKDILEDGL